MGTFVDKDIVYLDVSHTAAVTFTNASYIRIPFQTENYDHKASWATQTWTVPVEGVYQINAQMMTASTAWTDQDTMRLGWYEAGAITKFVEIREEDDLGDSYKASIGFHCLRYIAAGTTCSLRWNITRGANTGSAGAATSCWMQIVRILPSYNTQ